MANNDGKIPAAESERTRHALLFVYGTLMRGGRLHAEVAGSAGGRFAGVAKIRGELYRPRGENYPGAVPTAKLRRFVYGELYVLNDPGRLLKRLDRVEGVDEGLFTRRLVDVWQNRKRCKAWTYFYAKSVASAEPIPHGKFLPVDSIPR